MTMFEGAEWDRMVKAGARAIAAAGDCYYACSKGELLCEGDMGDCLAAGAADIALGAALRVTTATPCATCGGSGWMPAPIDPNPRRCQVCGTPITGYHHEPIEVTRSPDNNGPGDPYRRFIPGPVTWEPCGHLIGESSSGG